MIILCTLLQSFKTVSLKNLLKISNIETLNVYWESIVFYAIIWKKV